jgi:hypothetical protein
MMMGMLNLLFSKEIAALLAMAHQDGQHTTEVHFDDMMFCFALHEDVEVELGVLSLIAQLRIRPDEGFLARPGLFI